MKIKSLLFISTLFISTQAGWGLPDHYSNNDLHRKQPLQKQVTPENLEGYVAEAVFYLAGKNHPAQTLASLTVFARQLTQQIRENQRTFGAVDNQMSFSDLVHQTMLQAFVEYVAQRVEALAKKRGFTQAAASEIARQFQKQQWVNIRAYCPGEIISPFQLPKNVFQGLIGDNLVTKINALTPPPATTIQGGYDGWDFLANVTAHLVVALLKVSLNPPTPTPTVQTPAPARPTQERHFYENPSYNPPVARSVNSQEETGLPRVYENTMDVDCMACGETFNRSHQRAFFPCGHATCCTKCIDQAHYTCPFRDTLKAEDIARLKSRLYSPNYCVVCYKDDGALQTLPRCKHKICGMCSALWCSLKAELSEFCPRCALPLR